VTPNVIRVVLDAHIGTQIDTSLAYARNAVAEAVQAELIFEEPGSTGYFSTTDKGAAYVDGLKAVPMPTAVTTWVCK